METCAMREGELPSSSSVTWVHLSCIWSHEGEQACASLLSP